jgi:hypothetical protein
MLRRFPTGCSAILTKMKVYDTFTHRRDRAANAGNPEVYVYDEMQKALLAQITLIWRDYFQRGHMYKLSNGRSFGGHDLWVRVSSVFSREKGLLNWPWQANEWHTPSVEDNVIRFFLDHASNDGRLNLIELVFSSFAQTLPEPVAELNERFRRAGFGYQFEGKQLIRMDSTVAHEEIVKPALLLLGGKGFEEADKQFRSAHSHYRRNEHPQAITEAGKAFESTPKAICAAKKWEYEKGARASDLIKVVVKNSLFPEG